MKIRVANTGDGFALTTMLRDGARDGHFAKTLDRQAESLVREILSNNSVRIQLRRGGFSYNTLPAVIYVAEENDQTVAFLLCLFHPESALELHLVATIKNSRRQGICRHLTRFAIQQAAPDARKVFARCYRKSTYAIQYLLSEGFIASSTTGDPIELALYR